MESTETQYSWFWQSNQNPWDKNEKEEWNQFSELESYMIESAYLKKGNYVELENEIVSVKYFVRISKSNVIKQSPIKRIYKKKETKKSSKEIFFLPTKKPKLDQCYETLPFIYDWCLKNHVLFEMKEDGIIDPTTLNEESSQFFSILLQGMLFELVINDLEKTAMKNNEKLKEVLDKDPKSIVKTLIYQWLSIPKFYNLINEAVFRYQTNKLETIGPFCYIVNLFLMNSSVKNSPYCYSDTVYRGLNMNSEQLEFFKEIYERDEYFTWGSFFLYYKDITHAKKIGNSLIVVDLEEYLAGTDLAKYTGLNLQGEVMLPPNSYFKIESIEKKDSRNILYIKRVI